MITRHLWPQCTRKSWSPTPLSPARGLQTIGVNGQDAGSPRKSFFMFPVQPAFPRATSRGHSNTELVGPSTKIENHRELAKQADALWSSRDMTSSFTANAVQRTRKVTSNQAQAKSRSTGTNQQLCFYHRTFGEVARQCRQPCTWTRSNKAIIRLAQPVTIKGLHKFGHG